MASARTRLLSLLLLAFALSAVPAPRAAAQLGYGPDGDSGLQIRVRTLGSGWQPKGGNGAESARGGKPETGRALDGFWVKHHRVRLEYQALVAGAGWQDWMKTGTAGVEGKPLEGLKIRTEQGSVRYRVSYLAGGFSDWAEDGEPIPSAGKGGSPFDSIEVELRAIARKGATLEYRARFKGHPFTPWVSAGTVAQIEAKDSEMVGLELRGGGGVRYEVAVGGRGWLPTSLEGETAGQGERRIEGVRLFGGASPLRYRLKLEGQGWTIWQTDGTECGAIGRSLRIEAIQIEPDRGVK